MEGQTRLKEAFTEQPTLVETSMDDYYYSVKFKTLKVYESRDCVKS
jgi:hypothetical protein